MDKVNNPYTPGAGTPPHKLVGREEIIEDIHVALQRTKELRSQQGIILCGLRGVGKTVLLRHCANNHGYSGIHNINIEVTEEGNLIENLVAELRKVMLLIKSQGFDNALVQYAVAAWTNFVRKHDIKVNMNFGVMSFETNFRPGLADSGTLEHDLLALLESIGKMAREQKTAIVLFIDELQYCNKEQLSALCGALHNTAQLRLPFLLIGAGLPQVRGFLGKAKSYAERMYRYVEIGSLQEDAATIAIVEPARVEGVEINRAAVMRIIGQTKGYPYFIQELGKNVWDVAQNSPITLDDVKEASNNALKVLDEDFFSVRYERLTRAEKRYLYAMAKLDEDILRSKDIAAKLDKKITAVAPIRAQLIYKGMVYSPAHGDTAFTVPLFGDYLMRSVRDKDLDV